MAFSHDKLTFFILCFIIPQLIIVKAQEGRMNQQQDYYYDTQESQSFEEKNVEFKGACKRDEGKF